MQESFRQLNRYYDKIYVLSVASAELRRKKFAKRFEGLEYSFFFGADKNKFSIDELQQKGVYSHDLAVSHHRYNKGMKAGEIACAWSHKMMYEDMVENKYQQALIFEDDAVPDPEGLKRVSEILEEIPADCGLLMWGWAKNDYDNLKAKLKKLWYHAQHRIGLLKWDHQVIRNLYARRYSANMKVAGFHDYTYAYAISQAAATKLINMQTPIQYIADNLLGFASVKETLNAYIAFPPVFLHDNLPDGTHRDSYIR